MEKGWFGVRGPANFQGHALTAERLKGIRDAASAAMTQRSALMSIVAMKDALNSNKPASSEDRSYGSNRVDRKLQGYKEAVEEVSAALEGSGGEHLVIQELIGKVSEGSWPLFQGMSW